jgi:outer membrane protein assembly factor BamD (BamD/ComL family)
MSNEEQAKPTKRLGSLERVQRMIEDPEEVRKVEAELQELEAAIESLEDEDQKEKYEFVDVDLD